MARAGVTPERLAWAAAELADEVGFDNVTASAVARGFGVTVASLYAHVANAHDLRVRVALLALEELADRVGDAVTGRAGKDALVAFGNAYRAYAQQHPGRYAAARLRLDPETAARSAGPRHSAMARAILRGYGVPDEEQNHAVRLLGSTFHGFVSLEASGGFEHSGDPETSWTRALDALDVALRNWPSPSA
ncbi:TetR/AcrR family transcriptional regulator [Actinomadura oligospora]|uniref:TetR/AcrR family transcriptional regulator n=1 Tax=Actinomadura oligospora TaxID=111804 RepID=UPI00047D4738|nr:TetR/AcrR family transcriptional regulator [Actinomadura oligospora]